MSIYTMPLVVKMFKHQLTLAEIRGLNRTRTSIAHNKNEVHRLAKKHVVDNTETLVRAFNSPGIDRKRRELLFQWFERYHKAFASALEENLTPDIVREYAELVKIKVTRMHHRAFQRNVLKNLTEIFSPKDEENENMNEYAKILIRTLGNMDRNALENASEVLHPLAQKLIQCIPADLRASQRDFPSKGYIFQALHQTLDLLYESLRYRNRYLNRFDNGMRIRTKCEELKTTAKCYRTWYYLKVIEQDIGRLNRTKFNSEDRDYCAMVGHMICGVLHCWHGLRGLLDFDTDIDPLLQGRAEFARASEYREIEQAVWYEPFQELAETSRAAIHQNKDIVEYQRAYDDALCCRSRCRREPDRKAFLFGQILILESVVRSSASAEIRKDAVEKLVELSKENNDSRVKFDEDILHAFLEAFHAVCLREEFREQVLERVTEIQQLTRDGNDRVRTRFEKWRNGKTIKDKLYTHESPSESISHDLFDATRTEAGHLLTIAEMCEHASHMRKKYEHDAFSKVSFFNDPFVPKLIKDMKFVMVEQEMDSGSTDADGDAGREHIDTVDAYNDPAEEDPASALFNLDTLFQNQEPTFDSEAKPGRKVLLVGDPGIGKTCFARSIACRWACNHDDSEFEAVYFVSVGELSKEEIYNETECQGDNSLERVLAKMWFSCEDTHTSPTITQIIHDLDSPKTLVIFDGVDEGNMLAKNLVSGALARCCSLLLTSRPWTLHHIQNRVDCIAKCSTFNDLHLLEFIHSEIREEGPELVRLLYPHPYLWRMAHIPMISHILCHLWKERKELEAKREITSSLWHLYERITRLIWDHLAGSCDRLGGESIKNAFDTMAEIAFTALKDGKESIERKKIERASKSMDEWALKHCGFLVQETMDSKTYRFLHLGFQEFFAGRYLTQIRKNPNKCRFSDKVVKEFLSRGKYSSQQRNAIAFMIEEFFQERVFDDFHEFVKLMDNKPPKNITSEQRLYAKLHSLNALLSSYDPSLMDDLKESDFTANLLESLRALIADHLNDTNKGEQLLSQLGQIPNVLRTFPDLVMEMTKTIGQDTSPSSTHLQYLIQIAAHVPEAKEWVSKTLEKQASHPNDDARERAIENIANVLVVSSGNLADVLTKLLEKESSKSESAAAFLKTIKGATPSAMESQLQLLERQRKILTGNVLSRAME